MGNAYFYCLSQIDFPDLAIHFNEKHFSMRKTQIFAVLLECRSLKIILKISSLVCIKIKYHNHIIASYSTN